jgi:hypothetical protein
MSNTEQELMKEDVGYPTIPYLLHSPQMPSGSAV